MPKLATVVLTVLLTAALAWWVTAGITARWDIRKKRQEFDLVLVKEFYELVGSFKSVAREAEALGPKPRPTGAATAAVHQSTGAAPVTADERPGAGAASVTAAERPGAEAASGTAAERPGAEAASGTAAERPGGEAAPVTAAERPGAETASAVLANWESKQASLAQRALETEMKMEAILLKLISEGPSDDGMSQAEWRRQRHTAGLLRTAFRNLRETVEDGAMRLPGYDSPEQWLFNRLAGEISKILYARSARSPKKPESAVPALDATDYMRLIVYRTGDLEAAVARISPKVTSYTQRRHAARQHARKANVHSVFEQAAYAPVEQLAADSQHPAPTLPITARAAVEFADQQVTECTAKQIAARLFAANDHLEFYLVLADRPQRVIAVRRDGAIANYTANQELPDELPWSAAFRPPVLGEALLAWDLDRAAEDALREIATVPLTVERTLSAPTPPKAKAVLKP